MNERARNLFKSLEIAIPHASMALDEAEIETGSSFIDVADPSGDPHSPVCVIEIRPGQTHLVVEFTDDDRAEIYTYDQQVVDRIEELFLAL